jgi:sec-independent protein translocase protein TatC
VTEERRQPILEHLNELRWRLVKSAVALTAGSVVAFFFRDWLFELLESPYRLAIDDTDALAQFQVTEGFSVAMRLALFGGTLLASPILLYQIWAFVNPALTTRERKWTVPIVVTLAVLFSGGVVFGYIILPRGLEFLLGIQSGLEPIIGVSSYISLALRFLLVFGLAFEFPVFLFAVAAAGLLSSQQLAQGRRWAILIIVVLGAVVTPTGDPLTLLALSIPLYLLYELTILLVKLILRK